LQCLCIRTSSRLRRPAKNGAGKSRPKVGLVTSYGARLTGMASSSATLPNLTSTYEGYSTPRKLAVYLNFFFNPNHKEVDMDLDSALALAEPKVAEKPKKTWATTRILQVHHVPYILDLSEHRSDGKVKVRIDWSYTKGEGTNNALNRPEDSEVLSYVESCGVLSPEAAQALIDEAETTGRIVLETNNPPGPWRSRKAKHHDDEEEA
jgi:hypothetical protein